MAAAPTETTAAARICRRAAIAMDQLGWGCDSCLSLSAPEVAPTEQLSPAPPPAGNPPLSPARPCCRFCRIACGIRTFAICFPCATRNFFLVPVLCTLLLRPHNAACCCARPARRPPLPPAALLLRLLRSHTVTLHRSTLAASRCAARGAPSRPAARTGWDSTDLILDTRRTSSMSLASKCARLRRAARGNFTRRGFYAGSEARARQRRRKIRWGIEHLHALN